MCVPCRCWWANRISASDPKGHRCTALSETEQRKPHWAIVTAYIGMHAMLKESLRTRWTTIITCIFATRLNRRRHNKNAHNKQEANCSERRCRPHCRCSLRTSAASPLTYSRVTNSFPSITPGVGEISTRSRQRSVKWTELNSSSREIHSDIDKWRGGHTHTHTHTLVDVLLPSNSTNRLVVPSFKLSTIGMRAFPVAASEICDALPDDVVPASLMRSERRRLWTMRWEPTAVCAQCRPGDARQVRCKMSVLFCIKFELNPSLQSSRWSCQHVLQRFYHLWALIFDAVNVVGQHTK